MSKIIKSIRHTAGIQKLCTAGGIEGDGAGIGGERP